MDYLGDTVTIIRHLSKTGKIGGAAKRIIEGVKDGEHRLFLSVVSLVEILYLSEKKRININLDTTLDFMDGADNYAIVDLNPSIVRIAESLRFPEIFDRLIISTSQYLGVPLLTSDQSIIRSGLVKTVWK